MSGQNALKYVKTIFVDERLNVLKQASSTTSSKPVNPPHQWRIQAFLPSKLASSVVALGDLNGDGTLDILTDYHNQDRDRSIEAWVNNGKTSPNGHKFSPAIDLPMQQTNVFAVGDMNGDGLADIVTGRKYMLNQVHLNRHKTGTDDPKVTNYRTIDLPESAGTVPSETKSITIADVDKDGDLDIIVRDSRRNRLLINDGSGENYEVVNLPDPAGGNKNKFVTANSNNIAVADMDNDGESDVLLCDNGPDKNILLKNTGGNTYGVVNLPGQRASKSLAVGDVNGDGFLDIVTGLQPVLLLNKGDGVNYDVIKLPVLDDLHQRVNEVALEDLNGDGRVDFIYCGMDGPKVLINRGDGSVDVYGAPVFGDYGFVSMALGDIDGDGILDLAMAHSQLNHSHMLLLSAGDESGEDGGGRWYNSLLDVDGSFSIENYQDDIVLFLLILLVLQLICMCCNRCKKRNEYGEGGVLENFGMKMKQKFGSDSLESEMVSLHPPIAVV